MREFAQTRRFLVPASVASMLIVAGCGGGGRESPSASSAAQRTARGCAFVDPEDVARVAGAASVERRDLAGYEGVVCSSAFAGGAGELVASVTELEGGAEAMKRLRAAKTAELGAASVRTEAGLGGEAFLARKRYLAFRHDDRIVVLEAGYDPQGRLTLSVPQLGRLARLIAGRL
jgi:hypothetical protein